MCDQGDTVWIMKLLRAVEVTVILSMAVLVNCISVQANVEQIRYIQYGVKLFAMLHTQPVTIYKEIYDSLTLTFKLIKKYYTIQH